MEKQLERRFGSFPRIEIRNSVHGRYEIVNVQTTKDGEKVPFLTGVGLPSQRNFGFDTSALIDSVFALAKTVRETLVMDGPAILREERMLRDGIPEEILARMRKHPGDYTPEELAGVPRWKNAQISAGFPQEISDRFSRHPDAKSLDDVAWDAVPRSVTEPLRKWYVANGVLIPMVRAVTIDDAGNAWTDETVPKTDMGTHFNIIGERRVGTPLAEILRRLQHFHDVYSTVTELVEFEKRHAATDVDLTRKWRLPERNRFNRIFFEGMLMTGSRDYGGFGIGLESGHWKGEGPGYYLYSECMLSGAYAQVVFSMMQGRKFCASPRCGRLFEPAHENQRFCEDCGEREKKRLAMQRYRAEKKRKQEEAGR